MKSGEATENGRQRPTASDVLLPFEQQNLHTEYMKYYEIKRHNFFATIQKFPKIWECFQLLDGIWMREFSDLERQRNPDQMLPILLFVNAHAQFRIAFELGFSCCIGEAWNVLRSAIESVAHAHKTLREPHLVRVWVEKDDSSSQLKAFEDAFLRSKKTSLFPSQYGLEELHKYWSQYSEWGTHTTVSALARRFVSEDTPTDVNWELHYFEADPSRLAISLFSLLIASFLMEKVFFSAFDARLKLDPSLVNKRDEFDRRKEETRRRIIKRFNIQPPTIWP